MRLTKLLLSVSIFLTMSAASLLAQRDRITSRIDDTRRAAVAARMHPLANAQNDQGEVDAALPMTGMTLSLQPSAAQRADLDQLLREQQDPASANYHRWLTPEEFAVRFGASAADVARVADWLISQGFTVDYVARGRNRITFSGAADSVSAAFRTSVHRYQVGGQAHYANASPPSVPEALAAVVSGIQGLNNFRMQPRMRRADPRLLSGTSHRIGPDDLAAIYNIAPLYTQGIDGTGQKIAVVGQSAIRNADIQQFRTRMGLSAPNVQTVLVPGSTNPGVVTGDVDEASLDVEWTGAVARNATIVYVYSNDVWQSATYAVDQNLAPVLSMSYGICELYDLADLPDQQSTVQQANAQGMTWFVASGDNGAADCEDPGAAVAQAGPAVDVPASIPEVTAMGGTTLNEGTGTYWSASGTALGYIPEKVWNDTSLGGGISGTGGGASIYFPQPIWQIGAGVPNDGARHVPDISFASSPNHDGYFVYSAGVFYAGGTSIAAPVMAGIAALLNQSLTASGALKQPGLGNINPNLYRLAQTTSGVFHDVTDGDNAVPCTPSSPNCVQGLVGFKASLGYDDATGLGSLDASALLRQWSSAPNVASAVVASINPKPVYQLPPDASGNPWQFTIKLSEAAGVATTLTGVTIDGVSYTANIATLFGGATLPARGSLTAKMGLKSVAVPKVVQIVFTGADASGRQWNVTLPVQFNGVKVPARVAGVSNAASGQQVFAPGMIVSVYGQQMGAFAQPAEAIPLPFIMAGCEAYVNGVPAPLYYVSPGQVNIQIPYETRPGTATVTVGNPYENADYTIQVAAAAPGIFTAADGSIVPARTGSRGQIVTLYITGEGAVTPSLATGTTPSIRTPVTQLPRPRQSYAMTVGGLPASIDFIGIPSGLVGVTQVNYIIPVGTPLGPQPVVVTIGGVASQAATLTVTQ